MELGKEGQRVKDHMTPTFGAGFTYCGLSDEDRDGFVSAVDTAGGRANIEFAIKDGTLCKSCARSYNRSLRTYLQVRYMVGGPEEARQIERLARAAR